MPSEEEVAEVARLGDVPWTKAAVQIGPKGPDDGVAALVRAGKRPVSCPPDLALEEVQPELPEGPLQGTPKLLWFDPRRPGGPLFVLDDKEDSEGWARVTEGAARASTRLESLRKGLSELADQAKGATAELESDMSPLGQVSRCVTVSCFQLFPLSSFVADSSFFLFAKVGPAFRRQVPFPPHRF